MPSPLSRRRVLGAGGAALLAGLAGCSNTTDDGETPRSTSATTSTGSSANAPARAAWTSDIGGTTALGPALADGTLYVGRADGQFVALDPASGDEHWSVDAGKGFFSGIGGHGASPTVVDGRVYLVPGAQRGVAGEGFRAVALDADSGEQVWTHSLDEASFLTRLGVHDGRVLVASSDDSLQNEGETLAALDPATGDVQWTGEVGDPRSWAVGAGGVYVASYAGIRAVSLTDGSTRWTKSGSVTDGLHVTGDRLVAGFDYDTGPTLAGFDPATGDQRWTDGTGRVTSYAAADGVVYAGGERAAAYDAADGSHRWTANWGGFVSGPPVASRLFVLNRGFLHAFDAASGERYWGTEVAADGDLTTADPPVEPGQPPGESLVAYVSNPEDDAVPPTLVARHTDTGRPALSVTFEDDAALTAPVVDGDAVFVATESGRVVALQA